MKQIWEYMVQMKVANPKAKWQTGHKPNNASRKVFETFADAEEYKEKITREWNEYEEKWKRYDESISENLVPREYRIIRRMVTEWEEVWQFPLDKEV